jgi:hypothetical protein
MSVDATGTPIYSTTNVVPCGTTDATHLATGATDALFYTTKPDAPRA